MMTLASVCRVVSLPNHGFISFVFRRGRRCSVLATTYAMSRYLPLTSHPNNG